MYREMTQSNQKWFACGAIHTRDDGNTFFHPMLPRWDDKMIVEDQHNFIGGVSVLSIKNEVKTRFDPNVKMLLDVDFYHNVFLNYGMPILYQDVLIANRVRDTNTLMAEVSETDVIEEFKYCHQKYGIVL